MSTYTVKWADANDGQHSHQGVDAQAMRHYVDALTSATINPAHQMTLVSVTLDEPADAQLDDIELARVEGSINP